VQLAVLVSTPQTRAESRALALRLSIDAKNSIRTITAALQFQRSVSGVKYPYDCAGKSRPSAAPYSS
jgi:hypothetical protein